ncbi:MAG TPA: protein-L-isoaspartate(D-aspartate) O-methyltransferase [Woeseiaceae bacterium]|jgi:protein-L-isoaspartate(D-aspartate) O-methyltransferase|nr:protein-L-isoaspartate(D-aspartate) O-methyltransferase [Woeseiaceae bacterium]
MMSARVEPWTVLGAALLLAATASVGQEDGGYAEQRSELVREIREDARYAGGLAEGGFLARVMRAIAIVPRHAFVPTDERRYAYANRPLPIGHGQTISQPYIVALMTHLMRPDRDDIVLEIGTGSGYQAAILAVLVNSVYTIEIIEPLFAEATARLERLGYRNVTTRLGDGYYGWEEHAPFDAIVVTAAASHVPPPLIRQLKPGGRLIIPVGGRFLTQQLLLIEKGSDGKIVTQQIAAVRFVPLRGEH